MISAGCLLSDGHQQDGHFLRTREVRNGGLADLRGHRHQASLIQALTTRAVSSGSVTSSGCGSRRRGSLIPEASTGTSGIVACCVAVTRGGSAPGAAGMALRRSGAGSDFMVDITRNARTRANRAPKMPTAGR